MFHNLNLDLLQNCANRVDIQKCFRLLRNINEKNCTLNSWPRKSTSIQLRTSRLTFGRIRCRGRRPPPAPVRAWPSSAGTPGPTDEVRAQVPQLPGLRFRRFAIVLSKFWQIVARFELYRHRFGKNIRALQRLLKSTKKYI